MNGRVYDYNLGRFMSVDPFIQAAGNSQSINPYSYIMNNPLAGTDPTGYVGCAASRIKSVCEGVAYDKLTYKEKGDQQNQQSVAVGYIAYNGNTGKSSDSNSMDIKGELEKAQENTREMGVRKKNEIGAAASTGVVGRIHKSQLGNDTGDSQEIFDEAYKFFENDESNQGEEVGFVNQYAISIRNASNHDETYAPKPFKSFEEANKYAGESFGEGYEKVWVFGYHQGGRSTIYKPATFSSKRLSGVERTISYLAHESYHFVPQNLNRIRRHPNIFRMRGFDLASQQAVQRYRDLKGSIK